MPMFEWKRACFNSCDQRFITKLYYNNYKEPSAYHACNSAFKGNACKLFVTKKGFYGEKLARNRKFYHFTSDRYSHELPIWHDKICPKKKICNSRVSF